MNSTHSNTTQLARSALGSFITFGLSMILFASAILHFGNQYQFLRSIYEYRLVSQSVGVALALILPSLQLVLAIGILSPIWQRPALLGTALLFAGYALAQLSVILRGLDVNCGCFGPYSESTGTKTLLFVLVLAGCALGKYLFNSAI
jgi:uncharacterized membrane protein YidH (DUF202 family)